MGWYSCAANDNTYELACDTSPYNSVFYKHFSEIQFVCQKIRKIKSSYLWENTVTGDKTWVSNTNQKQNAEVSNRNHALTEWKKCVHIVIKGQYYADLLLYQKIHLLWICSCKTVKPMKQILKYWNVHQTRSYLSSDKWIWQHNIFPQKTIFCFMLPKLKVFKEESHFQSFVDIQRNVVIVLLEKLFSNSSRYSKDIQIKGTAWRLLNPLPVFDQNQIVTPLYIYHCNTNMQ